MKAWFAKDWFFKIFQQPADENTTQGFAVAADVAAFRGGRLSRITMIAFLPDALGKRPPDQFSIWAVDVDGPLANPGCAFEPTQPKSIHPFAKRTGLAISGRWDEAPRRTTWLGQLQAKLLARALERLRPD